MKVIWLLYSHIIHLFTTHLFQQCTQIIQNFLISFWEKIPSHSWCLLMTATSDGDVGWIIHEVAGGWHGGREDVEERLDSGEATTGNSQHYEQPAVDTLPLGNYSGGWKKVESLIHFCADWPGHPILPGEASVSELHVKEGGKDKSKESHCRGPDQVENGAKARNRLGNEQQHKCGKRAQGNSFPVEAWRWFKLIQICFLKSFTNLRGHWELVQRTVQGGWWWWGRRWWDGAAASPPQWPSASPRTWPTRCCQ